MANKPEYGQRYREKNRATENARRKRNHIKNGRTKVRDPIKEKARHWVRNRLAYGALIKPEACPECGRKENIHAHHDDYSKPHIFHWLCSICHGLRHRAALRPAEEGK